MTARRFGYMLIAVGITLGTLAIAWSLWRVTDRVGVGLALVPGAIIGLTIVFLGVVAIRGSIQRGEPDPAQPIDAGSGSGGATGPAG